MNLKSKTYRDHQRAEMIYETKKDRFGRPLCHLCGENVGVEMHEIINRAQTNSNETALRLTFNKLLCALLCRTCHTEAMTYENEARLWQINFSKYGEMNVRYHISKVAEALGFYPNIYTGDES